MATGDTRVADPGDTVDHEMDSLVRTHYVYKSEPAGQSTYEFA